MTTRRRSKFSRMRGSHTHGWGAKKKHRGAGHRGGRGNAGLMKHKKIHMVKFDPDHFGRIGFNVINRKIIKSINLKQVDQIARKRGIREIDLTELGYNKLLSTGKLTVPLKIKVEKCSKNTKQKVEKFGGSLIGVEDNESN